MDSELIRNIFKKASLPFDLDKGKEEKFYIYLKELCKWNEKINLTSIKFESEIVEKLFLDSVFFLKFLEIKPDSVCLDIGSGAGFPGMPIKILCPGIDLTLLEATKKKGVFLKHLMRVLSLNKTRVITKRFEEICGGEFFLERFDLVTVRAVSLSPKLIRDSYKLLRQRGILLYFGGEKAEIDFSLEKFFFTDIELRKYKLPVSKLPRTLLIFRKEKLSFES